MPGVLRQSFIVPFIATLVIHALVGFGLEAAATFRPAPAAPEPMKVSFEVQRPPPPPPPPKVEEPPPPPPPARRIASTDQPKPPPRRAPPPPADTPPPPPAPPPAGPETSEDPAPPAPTVVKLPGTMTVPQGTPGGRPGGTPGGTGAGPSGGGPPGSTGTGRPVALASLKRAPEPIGDWDYVALGDKYPPIARRQGLEGTVILRLLVNEQGVVEQIQVVKAVGADIDDDARRQARKLRFRPGIADDGKPVSTWLRWEMGYRLPD